MGRHMRAAGRSKLDQGRERCIVMVYTIMLVEKHLI